MERFLVLSGQGGQELHLPHQAIQQFLNRKVFLVQHGPSSTLCPELAPPAPPPSCSTAHLWVYFLFQALTWMKTNLVRRRSS